MPARCFCFPPVLTAPGGESPWGRLWRENGYKGEEKLDELDSLAVLIWVFLLVMTLGTPAVVCVAEELSSRREAAMIRTTQNKELGQGVTLLQGVRSCFGEEGQWIVRGRWVDLLVSSLAVETKIVYVDRETSRLELRMRDWIDEGQGKALAERMVEAAQRQKEHPKT